MTVHFTDAEERRFAALWKEGVTVAEILVLFKIGQSTMDKLRIRLGLPARLGAFWTPTRVEDARRLYIDEGKSAAEVAAILGHGATRNTIIGKAHRMGWMASARKPASKPARLPAPPKIRAPRNKPALVFGDLPRPANDGGKPAAAPAPVRVTLASIESPNARPWMDGRKFGECTWLIGEGMSALSCCNPVLARGWCAGHHAVGTDGARRFKGQSTGAASFFTRSERIERDRPNRRETERTIWDEARAEAA
jgi:hypothetical protein